MPAYFFEDLVHLTGQEFDTKFKSMSQMYNMEQGDPVERLREMAAEASENAPSTILSGAGKTRRLMPGRFYFFKYLFFCPTFNFIICNKIIFHFYNSFTFTIFNIK